MRSVVNADDKSVPLSASVVDALADDIRLGVMTGRFPVGSYLRQAALAEEFGVSRTPIREALRKLQPEGIIEVLPNRGAYVRGPTPREIREAYVVRAELESLATELAVRWISDEELARLRKAEEIFRRVAQQPGDAGPGSRDRPAEWIRANDMFHEVIQEAARNEQLRRAILFVYRSVPRNLTGRAMSGDQRMLRRNVGEHAAIVEAIVAQDAPAARERMREHILHSGEIVTNWFELQLDALGEGR
ncbi:MAG: GntR family transcriptional regulator [Solirubrobacteraceae bacterium]